MVPTPDSTVSDITAALQGLASQTTANAASGEDADAVVILAHSIYSRHYSQGCSKHFATVQEDSDAATNTRGDFQPGMNVLKHVRSCHGCHFNNIASGGFTSHDGFRSSLADPIQSCVQTQSHSEWVPVPPKPTAANLHAQQGYTSSPG